MDDLMRDFLAETSESLNILDVELVRFEQNPADAAILMNIFRLMHTIKGTCGFLGLARLERVAHAGEDVLGRFRDGALQPTPEAVSVILACIDRIREILAGIEASGGEEDGDDSELTARLRAVAAGEALPPAATAAEAAAVGDSPEAAEPMMADGGFPVAAELLAEFEAAAALPLRIDEIDPDIEVAAPAAGMAATPKAESAPGTPARSGKPGQSGSSASGESLRVKLDVLENLMTLISELVITRNHLLQMVRSNDHTGFAEPLQRLSQVTSALQQGVMMTRMQPVGNAWGKLPRLIRDLAVDTGKKLDLEMIGSETELDRQVLELIKDPITHMVRNSADHGIEAPHERLAAGKPETGRIGLRAFHEGGHIIIEIRDDGRGLDTGRIRRKVLGQGLASEADLDAMTDAQVQQFIFKPGFSTAEKVTSVSGRGVGMDVVRTNVERIGGTIELKSVAGRGSIFTIKIPLTLAIVSALIVACARERFAIPQLAVRELVYVSPNSDHSVENINNAMVLRLRNRLLPLVSLHDLLALSERKNAREDGFYVVVSQVGAQEFGIVVDQVFDTEEIVVKPVARMLRQIPFYSGNTILGDGSVIMILDPNGIAAKIGLTSLAATDSAGVSHRHDAVSTRFIIFRDAAGARKAVPMALVARLEKLPRTAVEIVSGRTVVQYRDQLMPVLEFERLAPDADDSDLPVLVFSNSRRFAGLVVTEIVDIVEEQMQIKFGGEMAGVVGTAVIGGKATDIIDAPYYLTQAYPDWFDDETAGTAAAVAENRRLLLVDDSPFFLNLLSPYLAAAGYDVVTAQGAEQALRLRDDGLSCDLIVSDLDMPGQDGFAFAKAVQDDERWRRVPMIALSTRAAAIDAERSRAAGFAGIVAKARRDDLLRALDAALQAYGEAA
jgi:two-component system chemotaxis sensor kinase CheA